METLQVDQDATKKGVDAMNSTQAADLKTAKETAEERKTRIEEMNGQITSIDEELGELRTSAQQASKANATLRLRLLEAHQSQEKAAEEAAARDEQTCKANATLRMRLFQQHISSQDVSRLEQEKRESEDQLSQPRAEPSNYRQTRGRYSLNWTRSLEKMERLPDSKTRFEISVWRSQIWNPLRQKRIPRPARFSCN